MWKISERIEIKSKPNIIWKYWTDVENWKQWDPDIEYSKLEGGFNEGSKGKLKPKSGPKAIFEITEVITNKQFKNKSLLPLTKLEFNHEIEESTDGVIVRHSIQMTGLLSGIFSKLMGGTLAKGLPIALQNLKNMVEMNETDKEKNLTGQGHAN